MDPWWKENSAGVAQDGEMSPRRKAPVGHGVQSIARVQPLVPEVSLLIPSSSSKVSFIESNLAATRSAPASTTSGSFTRRPLISLTNRQPSIEEESEKDETMEPTSPTGPKRHLFQETGGASSLSLNQRTISEENPSSPTSKAFYQMLTGQADQIQKLQEQLSELMMHSRLSSGTAAGPDGSPSQLHGVQTSLPNSPTVVDSSTQTSAPPSPEKVNTTPSPQCKCQSPDNIPLENTRSSSTEEPPLESSRRSEEDEGGIKFGESASALNQQKGGEQEGRRGGGGGGAPNSKQKSSKNILSEDVLRKNHFRRNLLTDDDLLLVNRQNNHPKKNILTEEFMNELRTSPAQRSSPLPGAAPSTPTNQSVDVDTATYNRLKQIGVSFISPEDMRGKTAEKRLSTVPPVLDTFYRPEDLHLSNFDTFLNTSESISTEDSLAINSAALKYLDDRQLTHMHIKRNTERNESPKQRLLKEHQRQPTHGLTEYGLPESQMSMATKQYLEGNEFLKSSGKKPVGSQPRKVLDNLTELLGQPKLS